MLDNAAALSQGLHRHPSKLSALLCPLSRAMSRLDDVEAGQRSSAEAGRDGGVAAQPLRSAAKTVTSAAHQAPRGDRRLSMQSRCDICKISSYLRCGPILDPSRLRRRGQMLRCVKTRRLEENAAKFNSVEFYYKSSEFIKLPAH